MDPLPILEKIASDSGIEIGWLPLDKYTPPCASATYNKIVMNTNWHNQNELAFQLAHEIAHILNHDECDLAFYHASFASKERCEYEANLGAIKLLLPIYRDMECEMNPVTFMKLFSIPGYLFDNVAKMMKE